MFGAAWPMVEAEMPPTRRRYASKWLTLVLCEAVMMSSGTLYLFPVYSPTLKRTLDLTQEQLNFVGSAAHFGAFFSVFGGLFFDAFGPRATLALGGSLKLAGLGALYGGFDMEAGTEGFMTGFAFPEILRAMNAAAQAGELERAHALYARYLPLMVFEQQPGVAVRKELYRLRGLIESGHVRHPGGALAPALKAALAAQIERSLPGIDITKPLPPELFA